MPQDRSIRHRIHSSGLAFLPVAGSVWLWLLAVRHLLSSMQDSEVWMPSSSAVVIFLLMSAVVTAMGCWALGDIQMVSHGRRHGMRLYRLVDDGETPVVKKIAALVFIGFCRVVLTLTVLPIMLAAGTAFGAEKSWVGTAVLAAGMVVVGLSSFRYFRVRDFIAVRFGAPVMLIMLVSKSIFRLFKKQ
jgi:hypothetical protein